MYFVLWYFSCNFEQMRYLLLNVKDVSYGSD